MKAMKITGHYIVVKETGWIGSRDTDTYTARNDDYYYVFIFG